MNIERQRARERLQELEKKGSMRQIGRGEGGTDMGGVGDEGRFLDVLNFQGFYNLRQKVMSSSVISGIGFGCYRYFRLVCSVSLPSSQLQFFSQFS